MSLSHKKTQLLSLVAHPLFLAIPFALAIILFLPNPTSKYKLELLHKEMADKPNSHEEYHDLNNDGIDERIVIFHNMVKGDAAIKIMDSHGVTYDQWNFQGHYQNQNGYICCTDANQDGFPEIYTFFSHHDTLMLLAFQPYPDKKITLPPRAIAAIEKHHGEIDYLINATRVGDLDGDGHNELIFLILAGYSKQPRGIFAYDLYRDTILRTPPMGAYISFNDMADLDHDNRMEILCGSSTPGNIHDSLSIPYSDYRSWFFCFDHRLQPKFPPIKNPAFPSSVASRFFTSEEGQKFMAVLYSDFPAGSQKLVFYHPDGTVASEKTFYFPDLKMNSYMFPCQWKGKPMILVNLNNGKLQFFNEKMELFTADIPEGFATVYRMMDLDDDGRSEYILQNRTGSRMAVLDHELKNPVFLETGMSAFNLTIFDVMLKRNGTQPPELCFKINDEISYYRYQADRMYYFKYLLWLGIYAFIALTFWLTQRLQSYQAQRRIRIEETINSLQMRTIKSQMDPHFMFNVLNGLAHNVSMGNTTIAHDQIIRFSTLLRSMIKKSERIDTPLQEEIEFVQSYLELEKFRFKEDFEFEIRINEDVNLHTRLPKMLIQIQVENSIKHGLRNKKGVKRISVTVEKRMTGIRIAVEDNGIGRKEAQKYTSDEAKGMKIMDDLIALHHKLGGKKIQVQFTDLQDEQGKPAGTRVELFI